MPQVQHDHLKLLILQAHHMHQLQIQVLLDLSIHLYDEMVLWLIQRVLWEGGSCSEI